MQRTGTPKAVSTGAPRAKPGRILIALYSYELGGSQILGLELAKQLADSGAAVLCTALQSAPGPLQQKCAEYGIETVDLRIPANILERNGISLALTRHLAGLKLDAIHLHHFLGLNKLGIPARLAGIGRVVVTEHSILDVSQSFPGRLRARFSWRLASAVTVVHQSIKDYLCTQIGVPPERVHVIPVGIETERYVPQRAAARAPGAPVNFVFVGRLAPVKNVPRLIEAFLAAQARAAPEARLTIVGDGEDAPACRDRIASHPLANRVIMTGAQIDPRPHLAQADVFVLNSRSEGTPRALLEAMAMGLPAIAPAIGALPDMLRGRGWLTVPGETSSLEATFETVLNNTSKIRELGDNCIQYVRSNFDARRVARQYLELLTE
jgi:glycosyltransferase involved in cell wall biosynthesis